VRVSATVAYWTKSVVFTMHDMIFGYDITYLGNYVAYATILHDVVQLVIIRSMMYNY
jgi:hypothetical protein